MNTHIALLRGINVGGKNKLPMKALTEILEGLSLRDVQTCIQSGNAVFRSDATDSGRLAEQIAAAIEDTFGFKPAVLLLTAPELRRAAANNPFPDAEPNPTTLHLLFLESTPAQPRLDALEAARTDRESFALVDKVLYLHLPDGAGRSKLAASAERLVGVPTTGRNWRTVAKILELLPANE